MIKEFRHKGGLIAVLLTRDHDEPGLNFITDKSLGMQLAYMKYPAGHRIVPHVHLTCRREIDRTTEAVIVRSGRVVVDLYAEDKAPLESVELAAGDVILLVSGGHGFRFLEGGELVEVKQGPFLEPHLDKEKFDAARR